MAQDAYVGDGRSLSASPTSFMLSLIVIDLNHLDKVGCWMYGNVNAIEMIPYNLT